MLNSFKKKKFKFKQNCSEMRIKRKLEKKTRYNEKKNIANVF